MRSAPPDGPAAASTASPGPSLLDRTVIERRRIGELIEREVEAGLAGTAASMAQNPSAALAELKTLQHLVRMAPELSAELRARLSGRLESALQTATRRDAEFQERQLAAAQARAAAEERMLVAGNLASRQERIKQLSERFDALMHEGRYAQAQSVADGLDVDSSPEAQVVRTSLQGNLRAISSLDEALAQRSRRQQNVVHALALVESASSALPDDEPIVYAQAEVWQELTRRRAKYARTDLRNSTPAEARVSRALAEPTNCDFVQTSLADAMAYLKDLHGIEIQFDAKALEENSIDLDAPVTQRLDGISLRSALRLLLGSLDLTYLIDNEVLLITTPDRAGQKLTTRVYPVGELVQPIRLPQFGSGFGPPAGFGGGQQGQSGQSGGGGPLHLPGQNQNNGNGQFPGVF